MNQADNGTSPQCAANGQDRTIVLRAEACALQDYLDELETALAAAPKQIRQLALDLINLAPELVHIQSCPATVACVAILLEPSQWSLDLAAAVRAGDLNWLVVEHSHMRPH